MKQINDNNIHSTAIVGDKVTMGKGNLILPYCVIEGDVQIGDDNVIGPFVVIGSPPTDTKKIIPKGIGIKIGHRNIIREFSIIEQPCFEQYTIIEDDVFIMEGVCVGHDVYMKNKSIAVNNTVIGGISKILEGAYLAMGSLINQVTVVGQYSIVAAGSFCLNNVKPFSRVIPSKDVSVNKYAILKYGFEEFEDEITEYVLKDIPVKSEKLQRIVQEYNEMEKNIRAPL